MMMTRRRPAIAGSALLAAALLTGCTTHQQPADVASTSTSAAQTAATQTSQAGATPATAGTGAATADLAVDNVVATYWAADTTTDTTPADAQLRARPWLTSAAAARITTDLPGGPGADWTTLASHHGRYVVTSTDATTAMPDPPPDTPTTASRGRILTLTPAGADGWIGTPRTLVVRLDLVDDPTHGWLVDHITTTDPGTGAGND